MHIACSHMHVYVRSGAGDAEAAGFRAVAAEVSPQQLRGALTFPPAYGPTDWGPIPFLPDPDLLVQVRLAPRWSCLVEGWLVRESHVSTLRCRHDSVEPLTNAPLQHWQLSLSTPSLLVWCAVSSAWKPLGATWTATAA